MIDTIVRAIPIITLVDTGRSRICIENRRRIARIHSRPPTTAETVVRTRQHRAQRRRILRRSRAKMKATPRSRIKRADDDYEYAQRLIICETIVTRYLHGKSTAKSQRVTRVTVTFKRIASALQKLNEWRSRKVPNFLPR